MQKKQLAELKLDGCITENRLESDVVVKHIFLMFQKRQACAFGAGKKSVLFKCGVKERTVDRLPEDKVPEVTTVGNVYNIVKMGIVRLKKNKGCSETEDYHMLSSTHSNILVCLEPAVLTNEDPR